jgi:hypothetical protein
MMNIIAVLDKLANGRQHVVKYRVTVSPTCEGCVVSRDDKSTKHSKRTER